VTFTAKELEYLRSQRLGRIATASGKNRPHAVPTGFRVDADGTIEVGGHQLAARRPLYLRNIETNPWVAFVVDDLASVNPWQPRGVTVRGRAEIRREGGEGLGPGFDPTLIVITPTHITSWGIEGSAFGPANSRKV
jgi:pyridoxamine 5'-phosphate oxidase family protein